ncbi:aldehyde dehydrogenase family protein [Pseudomonas sp. TH41]|uniref:aldehyde dehydrogenase family protein n=1 Tax=Pseudomonas sp. TH41 TaxID=2796405 RepID=UPI001912DADE|nr:aldehyde dehydrogenase family protein [Pseudomonas sp. TH41]MBK5355802.1 aldehyde dehydrogenase family protein [Pseudomonas sp. TH41]
MSEIKHFISGEFVASHRGCSFDDINTANGSVIAKVHECCQVGTPACTAHAFPQGEWGLMPVAERIALLRSLVDCIDARFDGFINAESLKTKIPKLHASRIDEVSRGVTSVQAFAGLVKSVPSEGFQVDIPDANGALNYELRRPRELIAVIALLSLPLMLMTWEVRPDLTCGSTVMAKRSAVMRHTTTPLGQVISTTRIPKSVCSEAHGFGSDCVTRHPGISACTFTNLAPMKSQASRPAVVPARLAHSVRRQLAIGYRPRSGCTWPRVLRRAF